MVDQFRRCLSTRVVGAAATLAIVLSTAPSHADEAALTRARVVEFAKAAPAARVAEFEAAVVGATVTAAGVLSLENPVLSGLGGVRFNPDGSKRFSGTATLSWPVEIAGQRGARVDAARAEHRAALATVENTKRRAVLGALLQHALVLRDEQQLRIAASRRAFSQRLLFTAEKRRKAGSVPELDVILTALQQQRDASAEAAVQGTRDADKTALLTLLGKTNENPPVVGTLVPAGEVSPQEEMIRNVPQRTDVRAAVAALDAARAKSTSERAARWPAVNVQAQYQRDDNSDTVMIGLSIPLPVLNANRANVLTSAAEIGVAKARLQGSTLAAAGEIKQLQERYAATRRALELLAPTVALVAQSVDLAARGYELGEGDLTSVLLVRREALDAQSALLEAQLAHANAKIELLIAIGRTPQ